MRTPLHWAIVLLMIATALAWGQGSESAGSQGAIKGLVIDSQARPVAGVKVEFSMDNGIKLTVETQQNGEFSLENVLPGTYSVSVSKKGYHEFKDTLKVEPEVLTTYKVTIVTEAEAKEIRGGNLWKSAQEAFKSGKFSEAEALFLQVIEKDPNYADAVFNLGITQARLGKCKEAITNLEKSISLQFHLEGNQKLTYYYALGSCYEKMNQLEKSLEPFQKLAELAPQQFTLTLGNLYLKLKQYDKARVTFEKFLQVSPDAPEAPQVRKLLDQLKSQGS